MIIVEPIVDKDLTDFERKYMGIYLEADGDPPKKARTREIRVTADSGKRSLQINDKDQDMDEIALDEDDEMGDIEDTSDDGEDPMLEPDEGDDDFELEDDGESTDEPEGDMTDDEGGDGENEETGEDTTGDGGGDGPMLEPDDGDDTSDNSGDGDDGGDSGDGEDSSQDSADKEEAIHKQSLFIKFNNLYESIDTYTVRLDQVIGKTDELNHQYRIISGNLKKLKEFLYDYMVIRFKDATYVECMLFYQRSVASINLCFDAIQDIKKQEANL